MKIFRLKKRWVIIGSILIAWLLFAQSCMKFRISDADAKLKFDSAGVTLHTATIVVNRFSIHYAYTRSDTLPTLFFVHGSPGSWDAFSEYMKDCDLLAKYRMVSVDRPGFGYSNFGSAQHLDEQSKLISPLLQQLKNGKPFCIIGHSLGGPLALKIAADNPGYFRDLVLLAASVDPAEEAPEKWRGILATTPFNYFVPGSFKPSNDELWYFKKDVYSLQKDFALINCTVWIVHGDADKFVPVGNAAYAQKMLVNAKAIHVKILKGAPHFIPWEPWYKDVKDVLMQLDLNE